MHMRGIGFQLLAFSIVRLPFLCLSIGYLNHCRSEAVQAKVGRSTMTAEAASLPAVGTKLSGYEISLRLRWETRPSLVRHVFRSRASIVALPLLR